ncbi:MAG TPA: hypothetical protein VMB71_02460 [Acetobacteraceae bacterium]|nr:hypothetical protein [Acetobacteraceae bacterium]
MAYITFLPFLGLLAAGAAAPLLAGTPTDRVAAMFAPGTAPRAALAEAVAAGFRPIAFGTAVTIPVLVLGRPREGARLMHAVLLPAFSADLCLPKEERLRF